MTNVVFVPGGWQGGWRNTAVAQRLRTQGYQVFTPTLTGLGERVHLANSNINLDTHIEDIANVLRFEDLTDVILCGHSYAGMVISGVADRLSERISALVYMDAFVPQDGDSWWDLAGDSYRRLALERSELDGFRVTPPAHMDPRCTPHPLASFRQAIRLGGRWESVKEKVFIYANGWKDTPFTPTYEALLADPDWVVRSFACGHNIVREDPEQLVALITGLRASQGTNVS